MNEPFQDFRWHSFGSAAAAAASRDLWHMASLLIRPRCSTAAVVASDSLSGSSSSGRCFQSSLSRFQPRNSPVSRRHGTDSSIVNSQASLSRDPEAARPVTGFRTTSGRGAGALSALSQFVDFTRTKHSLRSASSSIVEESLWGLQGVQSGARGGALSGTCAYKMAPEALRWGLAAAATTLLLKRNPGVRKQPLIPILALEASNDIVSFIKSDYGLWVAFVGLSMRLFYHIPADLDFPLGVYLFIIAAPAQALGFRGTLGGSMVSMTLALITAYQYFTSLGGIRNAFKREALVNTVAIFVLTITSIMFFSMLAA